MSTNSTNPATLFGFGTWTRITGQFLLGATDNATNSGASYAAGQTGGAASVTLTAAQSGVPEHSHGNTIKATTPKLTHSITQPAFNTPKLTHTITQPVFKYTAPKSHSHNLSNNGWAYITASTYVAMKYKTLSSNWTGNYGIGSAMAHDTDGRTHSDVTILGGATDSASAVGTENGATASRTTNVAVGDHAAAVCTRSTNVAVEDHAATNCTMSGSVSNNTAAAATSAHTNMPPFQAVYIWYRSA